MNGAVNLYRRLRELLPAPPLLVGLVSAHNADGTSTLVLPGGGSLRARGTPVAPGLNAFVRDGIVEGEAPALAVVTIEI